MGHRGRGEGQAIKGGKNYKGLLEKTLKNTTAKIGYHRAPVGEDVELAVKRV